MATYVERDGDWVWRPPGLLEGVTMYLFVLRAESAPLEALCQRYVNGPSGNAVEAHPLLPGPQSFVLLTCADIARGRSDHPDDRDKGFMPERDVGFFVPVSLTANGTTSPAVLLPYLFVDSLPALLIGREIFGFPKLLGDMTFQHDPPFVEVRGDALGQFDADRMVLPRPLIRVRRRTAGPLQSIPAIGPIANVTAILVQAVLAALGSAVPLGGFAKIPMVFLKQFRDASVDGDACHQSIVRAEASIDAITDVALMLGEFVVALPPRDSLRIADTLGLTGGPFHAPLLAIRVRVDFSLPLGTTLWTAP